MHFPRVQEFKLNPSPDSHMASVSPICMLLLDGLFRRVYKIAKIRLLASSWPPIRPPAWNCAPTGRIFMKFKHFFRKSVEKIYVSLNVTRVTGTLHKDTHRYTGCFRRNNKYLRRWEYGLILSKYVSWYKHVSKFQWVWRYSCLKLARSDQIFVCGDRWT